MAEQVQRVVFVGAESTGKSTLSEHLAHEYGTVAGPEIGRFISEDPIGLEGGMNLYAYAGNMPMDAVYPIRLRFPHRGASLFFGRNEEEGLRCVYHGWKFDVTGACVEMPNEPAESDFKHKVKATAYPTQERNGIVWAYLGPPDRQPPFPTRPSSPTLHS